MFNELILQKRTMNEKFYCLIPQPPFIFPTQKMKFDLQLSVSWNLKFKLCKHFISFIFYLSFHTTLFIFMFMPIKYHANIQILQSFFKILECINPITSKIELTIDYNLQPRQWFELYVLARLQNIEGQIV